MKQYAVTLVVYVNAEDQFDAKDIIDHLINESYLYKDKGEYVQVVDTEELNAE